MSAPRVIINTVELAGDPEANAPVLGGLTVEWGGTSENDQPNPTTLSFEIVVKTSLDDLPHLRHGSHVGVTDGALSSDTVFAGRIRRITAAGYRQGYLLLRVTAVDYSAELESVYVSTALPEHSPQARETALRTLLADRNWVMQPTFTYDGYRAPQSYASIKLLSLVDRYTAHQKLRRFDISTNAGAGVVRTNYHTNPDVTLNATGHTIYGTGLTGARSDKGGWLDSVYAYRVTFSTAGAGSRGYYFRNMLALDAGDVWTQSLYVRPSWTATLALRAEHLNKGAQITGGTITGPAIVCPANVWTRLSVTTAAPALGDELRSVVTPSATGATAPAAGTLDIDAGLVEKGPVLGTFFSGSMPTVPGKEYFWDGTIFNSTSQEITGPKLSMAFTKPPPAVTPAIRLQVATDGSWALTHWQEATAAGVTLDAGNILRGVEWGIDADSVTTIVGVSTPTIEAGSTSSSMVDRDYSLGAAAVARFGKRRASIETDLLYNGKFVGDWDKTLDLIRSRHLTTESWWQPGSVEIHDFSKLSDFGKKSLLTAISRHNTWVTVQGMARNMPGDHILRAAPVGGRIIWTGTEWKVTLNLSRPAITPIVPPAQQWRFSDLPQAEDPWIQWAVGSTVGNQLTCKDFEKITR